MATSLSITAGALTRTVTAANDAKAQAVLLNYAEAIGVPDSATNAERADAILASLVAHMRATARGQYMAEQRASLLADADSEIQF